MQDNMITEFLNLRHKIISAEFSRMNEFQREAVLTTNGPLLVLAGAGSGKTTVLVNRIACILKYGNAANSEYMPQGLNKSDITYLKSCLESSNFDDERLSALLAVDPPAPWKIIAITFTNKAANEMKKRLSSMLGEKASDIWACTFHSACARILRRDIDKLDMGYSGSFTIYDTNDVVALLRDCCREIAGDDRSFVTKTAMPIISRAKEKNLDPAAFEASAGTDYRLKKLAVVYYKYQEALRRANALDFDDMLRLTVKLFEKRPEVLEHYQNRFKYVLVDEYQDTNHVQYKLVSMLAGKHKNLCVVGDDDQSIYRFRGATIENILSFEHQFKAARVIKLEQNYRSTSVILDAANAVIKNNAGRKGKNLWTENSKGENVTVCRFDDEPGESQYIADTILEGIKGGMKFAQHAVLYRMNAQSSSIEKAFVRAGIPYRIIGGHRFYERLEIKDIVAYLCVLKNTGDNLHFSRIVNVPKRSIGSATAAAALEIAEQVSMSLYDVFLHCDEFAYFSKKVSRISGFMKDLEDLRGMIDNIPLHELIKNVMIKSGYLAALEAENDSEAKERIENLSTLVSNAAEYEKNTDEPTLEGFLEEAALMADIDNYDNSADTVVMMTVHSSKGLEFPVVFIAGMEEGIFPGQNSAAFPEELEEERRLAYVAITRAKEKLHISYARGRMLFGSTVYNRPSRFIAEIPDELKNSVNERPVVEKHKIPAKVPAVRTENRSVSQKHSTTVVYSPGDTVLHNVFGRGMVLSSKPMGGDTLLEIAFESFGTKKLMSNFARLTKE